MPFILKIYTTQGKKESAQNSTGFCINVNVLLKWFKLGIFDLKSISDH